MRNIPQAEYDKITASVPIACVDLFVLHARSRKVLLIRRRLPPCAGEWWFPGGRILHGETRREAVTRKLREECGLVAQDKPAVEVGTYEFIFGPNEKHSITTLYEVFVDRDNVVLDDQSSEFEWRTKEAWILRLKDGWIRRTLQLWSRR